MTTLIKTETKIFSQYIRQLPICKSWETFSLRTDPKSVPAADLGHRARFCEVEETEGSLDPHVLLSGQNYPSV